MEPKEAWTKTVGLMKDGIVIMTFIGSVIAGYVGWNIFVAANQKVPLGQVSLSTSKSAMVAFGVAVFLYLIGFVMAVASFFQKRRIREMREKHKKEIQAIQQCREDVEQMKKDLGWEQGYFPFNGAEFKIRPVHEGNLWIEWALQLDSTPRCPHCRGALEYRGNDLACGDSECPQQPITGLTSVHNFYQEASRTFQIRIEDWKENRKDSPDA